MAEFVRVEFAVEMTCGSCVDAVKHSLREVEGVKDVLVNLEKEQVMLSSSLPSAKVQELIESTGRRAVLKGLGTGINGSIPQKQEAAVAMMTGGQSQGVTRMVQTGASSCVLEGTLDGLTRGKHALFVHELGDISNGCTSCGDIYPVTRSEIQAPLGTVDVADDGRADFRFQADNMKISELIGRSMILHSWTDPSKNSDNRVACGIIARSSGLFENSKRFCACDGRSLWDERDFAGATPKTQAQL